MKNSFVMAGIAMAATGALLAGCGGNDDMSDMGHTTSSAAPPAAAPTGQQAAHNQQDITFAEEMIQHHTQALDMAELVPSRSSDPKVLDLATRIEKAQDPEIERMQEWLTAWGAAAPATPSSSSDGAGHGSMPHGSGTPMPGMMTEDEMKQLEQAKGAEFDRLWLELMIKHHQGAVEMARTELGTGANADAKALAQQIIDAQQAEISEMDNLLKEG
ncbi:DUF305 domain-containing protein [Amycolatopsis sp. YIM 10]|uniref:DUF305 domain-containing protein n=1 Tax=Amycolatopsis sp. YIM 10 TaxID=2653857 RepID=UPI0012904330|nr:DUF305 domain-containing protein [Amycolatopsis sp. YIM 10]QFU89683.1 hypothetical protein YIM_22525 [Amycolatopsis sp. YIM 10]